MGLVSTEPGIENGQNYTVQLVFEANGPSPLYRRRAFLFVSTFSTERAMTTVLPFPAGVPAGEFVVQTRANGDEVHFKNLSSSLIIPTSGQLKCTSRR